MDWFNKQKACKKAEKMGANATEADIQNVAEKMNQMKKGPLAKVWYKVNDLWNAFKSPDTPKWVKASIIGGLIYMVSPIDLVPDFLPGGLLDDAFVIGFLFYKFIKLAGSATIGLGVANQMHKKAQEEALEKEIQDYEEKLSKEAEESVKKHNNG